MEKYIINEKTIALCPLKNKTRVYEENYSFVVDLEVAEIMDDSCMYYGSSFDGRRKGAEEIVGCRYKVPIIVSETDNIIFFPTESVRNNTCTWIRASKIENYRLYGNNILMLFKDGSEIILKKSFLVIENQILKASRLDTVLRERKSGNKV